MQQKTPLYKITISNYIRQVKISEKQRDKYWEWNGKTIKSGSKKLLQKYINPLKKVDIIKRNGNILPSDLKPYYSIVEFRGDKPYFIFENTLIGEHIFDITEKQKNKTKKCFLCNIEIIDKTNIKINREISNSTQAGKPKYHIIKGQDFYVGLNPFVRSKIVNELKLSYYNVFCKKSIIKLSEMRKKLNDSYPLYIEMEIKDTIKNKFDRTKKGDGIRWDVGNRAEPYMKTFLDFLTNGFKDENDNYLLEPFIKDDDRLHLTSGNNSWFTPIKENEIPELIFYIYKDNRQIFNN